MQLNRITVILILSFLTIWCSTSQDKIGTKNDHLRSSYRRKHTSTSHSRYPLENQKHSVDKKLKYHNLRLDSRIIGGSPARIEDYPFVAELAVINISGVFGFCGATIVSLRWTITAANCFAPDIDDNVVKANKAYILSNSANPSHYTVSKHRIVRFHSHEEFSNKPRANDIAVIRVKEPFSGVNEKPIRYVKRNYVYEDDSNVTALGWESTIEGQHLRSRELQYVKLEIDNLEHCRKIYFMLKHIVPNLIPGEVTDRMVCAYAPGKDISPGDYGAPLVQNNKLIGIASWGAYTATENVAVVYTRISMYHDWIKSKICKKYRRSIRRRNISTRQFKKIK